MYIKVEDLEAVLAAATIDPDSGEVDMGALLKGLHTVEQLSWEAVYNEGWIDAEKNPPTKSGYYLVVYSLNQFVYTDRLHYSAKHEQWNNFDCLPKDEGDLVYSGVILRYMPFPTSMCEKLQREYDKEVEDNACDQ